MPPDASSMPQPPRNVLGDPLGACCHAPVTGFYRAGYCCTGPEDVGRHLICTRVTAEFLAFSQRRGNDLSTPRPEFDFPGLVPGDRWCLCALRWKEAFEAGLAPPVLLASTHENALHFVTLAMLRVPALYQH